MPNSILFNKRLRGFFVAWWLVWMIMQFLVLNELKIDDTHAILDSIVSNVLLALSCIFLSNNLKYYLPQKEKYWYIIVLSLVLSLLWMIMQQLIIWTILKDGDPYLQFIKSSWAIRFGVAFLLISSMSMFSLMWYNQQEQKNSDNRKAEAERLSKEAELFKLRHQLQPHFLFNSLNSISALVGYDPEKARYMIHQLSDFLRGTLKNDEQQWNTLEEELKYLQLYLDIEKVRFGHRLNTEINYKDEILSLKIPSLLLQPVVENAIKFGLYDTTGEVLIKIEATREQNNLKLIVQNPFDPETSQPLKGTGFGLSSIQRRLFLLFARNDLLTTKKDDTQFITTIIVPQSNESKQQDVSSKQEQFNQMLTDEIINRVHNKIDQSIKRKMK